MRRVKLQINRIAVALGLIFVVFSILTYFVSIEFIFDLVNGLAISVFAGVVVVYIPGLIEALRTSWGEKRTGHIAVTGIVLLSLGVIYRISYLTIWRWLGNPPGWIESPWLAAGVLPFLMGGVLMMLSANAIDGYIPRRVWIGAGLAVSVGVMIGLTLFFFLQGGHPV